MSRRQVVILSTALLGLGAAFVLICMHVAPDAESPLPAIVVAASFPGADAQAIADTVAVPIENQLDGLAKVRYLSSQSARDGTYRLTVAFEPNVDLDQTQREVNERLVQVIPFLPAAVRELGVTVSQKPSSLLAYVMLVSPDDSRDTAYLVDYAAKSLKGESARLPGVGDVTVIGNRKPILKITIDPRKLAAFNLTLDDVTSALKERNLELSDISATQITVGGPIQPEFLPEIFLKMTDTRVVRVWDVAQVEAGVDAGDSAVEFDGKPVVLLGVPLVAKAQSREVNNSLLNKLQTLSKNFPQGVEYKIAFNFAQNLTTPNQPDAPEYLRLDLELPDGASAERTESVLRRACKLLEETPGVAHVLAGRGLAANPATHRAVALIRLAPADGQRPTRDEIQSDIRTRLNGAFSRVLAMPGDEISGATLTDLTAANDFPFGGDELRLMIENRGGAGLDIFRSQAEAIAADLRQEPKFTNVFLSSSARLTPQISVEIDRAAAHKLGVAVSDIEALAHSANLRDQTGVSALHGRNAAGETFSLDAVAKVKVSSKLRPTLIERFNLYQAVTITVHRATGVSTAEARKACDERLKQYQMPRGIAIEWQP